MTESLAHLGRLKKVDPREVWSNEADDFTPWLAEDTNLRLLAETIGLELDFEALEKDVGPFRADILCKDAATGDWVLIENQLERTDHTHLGQLLTYAAGLDAVTVVWIANPFTEEHRAALDWLNSITGSEINFFGLEIESWQIGESLVAPKFNIISKPNDWSRTVSEAAVRGELTENQETQLRFWAAFKEFVSRRETTIRTTKPHPQNWMNMSIGRSGFNISAVASFWNSDTESYETDEVRAEFVITHEDIKEYFKSLESQRDLIEKEIGYPLVWHSTEEARMCRIYVRKSIDDLKEDSAWNQYHEWLLKHLEDIRKVFGPRVQTSPPSP